MKLTAGQLEQYDRDGFLLLPELLSARETAVLGAEVERLKSVSSECVFREGESGTPKIMFKMDDPAYPTYSESFRALSRLPRTLGVAQQVLRDEALYMHHYKLNMKAAIEGSIWQWHQDYMSWKNDGITTPHMASLLVMLSPTTELSGCLYFLPGTHKMRRIEPSLDDSTAYNLLVTPTEQMKSILADHPPPVPIVGEAGTAAIFNCNLLHASGHNLSHRDRWGVFMCFNPCANRPEDVPNPRPEYVRGTCWEPLELGPDTGVLDASPVAA